MTALHDQAARDSVRDVHDVSLFVEAGAGTGKTTALVDRVVSLVASGHVDLRHLAAITFTEAAAAELRDRVRAALERVAAGDDDRLRDETARDRCTRALSQLDDAALTTLHGFAQRLLSEHPFEVGLPPGFRILDDVEASVDFDQRWAAFVDGLFDDTTLEPALMSWIAGDLSVERLRQVAHVFCEYHDRLAEPAPPEPFPPLRIDELIRALDGLRELRERACGADDDPLARHIAELAPARDGLANAGDHLDQLQAVFTLPTLERKRAGRKPNWTDVDAARSACAAAEQLHLEVITEQRRAALTVLAGRLVSFARDYAALRRGEGRLLFHDLLVLARDLLRNHPAAWAAASDRYRYLLVDEFQDTDPLQIELAVLLAAEAPHPGNLDWRDVAIRPGSLVLVGDPKQSIYRFRGADLRVYHQARERLGLSSVELVENFRSVPPILTVVNTVFAELLTEDPGVQAAHAPLVPHREGSAEQHRVVVLGADYDESMAHVREREADEVAAVAQQIVAEGWPVHDPDGAVRPAAAHDIALLIPSRTVLPALEGALERAGVPVRVESQSLVFSTSEIRDLLNILAAIDDPTDELAVVAALRASAFGCSDAELVGHATAGGTWDYRRDTQPEGRVNGALATLHGFWQDRWWRSVSGTVEAVVRQRRLFELAAMHRRPRDHWRRIRFLLDQARAWEDAGGTSLRRFVEWATRQADEGVRVNEAVAPEPDDPALRILTVHGAKGLEFPIVILAGLNTLPANQPAPVLWGPHGPELRVGVGTSGTLVTTPGYDAERADEQRHEHAERLRLLYVAMTRARDHLVVSLHHKTSSHCAAKLLAPGLDQAAIARLAPAPSTRPPRAPLGSPPASAAADARERWQASRAAMLARAGMASSVAATTLAEAAATERDEAAGEVEPRPPWRRGRAGTAVGRAVHAVLQSIDLETGAGLDATARAQALAEGVADREGEVRDLVASVLATPLVREAVTQGWDSWRELPVAAEVGGILVEGFIDLLVRSPDGLVVVDYKTDVVASDADVGAAVRRYALQGAAYAVALEAALGEPVIRCVFVFARLPRAAEQQIPDLGAATAAVRERLAAIAG